MDNKKRHCTKQRRQNGEFKALSKHHKLDKIINLSTNYNVLSFKHTDPLAKRFARVLTRLSCNETNMVLLLLANG
jgi:hypothetical protein